MTKNPPPVPSVDNNPTIIERYNVDSIPNNSVIGITTDVIARGSNNAVGLFQGRGTILKNNSGVLSVEGSNFNANVGTASLNSSILAFIIDNGQIALRVTGPNATNITWTPFSTVRDNAT